LTAKEIEIVTVDGKADGVLFEAEEKRPLPGVIFLTDIGGIRPSQHEMAQRLAEEGYTVLMPNIFYRTSRAPLFELPVQFGAERTNQRIKELSASLTPEAFEKDATAYVDFMGLQPVVGAGPMGVVGYCFSGALALRMAAMEPARIGAAASFHGGRLVTDDASSPHLLLERIHGRLYFGHAEEDRSMPKEAIAKLNAALEAWGGRYESEVYQGAHHGWTVPDLPSYNSEEAQRAFEKLKELFARTLG